MHAYHLFFALQFLSVREQMEGWKGAADLVHGVKVRLRRIEMKRKESVS